MYAACIRVVCYVNECLYTTETEVLSMHLMAEKFFLCLMTLAVSSVAESVVVSSNENSCLCL